MRHQISPKRIYRLNMALGTESVLCTLRRPLARCGDGENPALIRGLHLTDAARPSWSAVGAAESGPE
jgi:hypothetical protein